MNILTLQNKITKKSDFLFDFCMGDKVFVCLFMYLLFSRQGFSVTLEPVLKLALAEQVGLKFTEVHLPLPPECSPVLGLKVYVTTARQGLYF